MAYVVCDVHAGLRESEATVSVEDVDGKTAFLRIEKEFLMNKGGRNYLPVGVIHKNLEGQTLIELPHEADSGVNRLWVDSDQVLEAKERAPV
jgi:hypothetical protein